MDDLALQRADDAFIGQTFQSVVSKMDLIGIAVDRDANLTYCNDYFLKLTGWQRQEVLGSNWFDTFLPPGLDDVRELHVEALNDVPASWHHENEILARSGERILVNWNNSPIRDYAGKAIGVACIGENITERRFLETKLLERIAHERHMLSADLHDGLGQSLYAARLLVDALKSASQGTDRCCLVELEQISALLEDSLTTCRRMTRGLSPTIKNDLLDALHALADASPFSSTKVKITWLESAPLRLQGEAAEHLYGIAREAVANARKHAQAEHVDVRLDIQSDWVLLNVVDDGIGIPNAVVGDGLGLKLMQYRANMLHGKLLVQPHLPRGTSIGCLCPNRAGEAALAT